MWRGKIFIDINMKQVKNFAELIELETTGLYTYIHNRKQ